MYRNSGLENEIKRELYIKHLLPYEHLICREAIDKLMGHNQFCPTLAEIRLAYETELRNREYAKVLTPKNTSCQICDGLGYVIEVRIKNELPYEYMLHCTCQAGDKWQYDGQNCKEHQSLYHINPVTMRSPEELTMPGYDEYKDITWAEAKEMLKKIGDKEVKSMWDKSDRLADYFL